MLPESVCERRRPLRGAPGDSSAPRAAVHGQRALSAHLWLRTQPQPEHRRHQRWRHQARHCGGRRAPRGPANGQQGRASRALRVGVQQRPESERRQANVGVCLRGSCARIGHS